MIKNIKRKFIVLATISMFLLMTLLVGIMNVVNYTSVVSEADKILDMLSQPDAFFEDPKVRPEGEPDRFMGFVPPGMSPEVPYESRFFSVMVKNTGYIVKSDISRIISVSTETLNLYVTVAMNCDSNVGFVEQFRYKKVSNGIMTEILFLDCGRRLDLFYTFMWISIIVGLSGCCIIFFVFIFASKRIVAPITESYEKQKRFISDAGHEIKTPLTIIMANLDLLEADYEGNEDLQEIRQQINRLKTLTNDLVYLSKMEESERREKQKFSVSQIVQETARSFGVIAESQKKEYVIEVSSDIMIYGELEAIRQLISILLDNAMKYSPEGGIVSVNMKATKKNVEISVFNTTIDFIAKENLDKLLERFYRTDESRNSELGGHGIGLSIAKAIVNAHNGKISAHSQNGYDLKIVVLLPLERDC